MKAMNARHDASYKHLFSSPKVVQHLIEGLLPDEAQQRLHSATSEELVTRADRVLDAQCLEEVFGT